MGKPSHQRKSPEADQIALQEPEMGFQLPRLHCSLRLGSQLGNSAPELAGREESILCRGSTRGAGDLQASIWCSLQKRCLVRNKKNGGNVNSLRASFPSSLAGRFGEAQALGWHLSGWGRIELYHGMLTKGQEERRAAEGAPVIHRLCLSTAAHSLVHSLHTVLCVSSFNITKSCVCHEGQALLQQNPPHLISSSLKPSPALSKLPLQTVSLRVAQHPWLHLRCPHLQPEQASETGGTGTRIPFLLLITSQSKLLGRKVISPWIWLEKKSRMAEISYPIFRLHNYIRSPQSPHQKALGTNTQI